jgi:hypothetical protein
MKQLIVSKGPNSCWRRRWESLELARIGPHEDGTSLKCYHEDLV